MDEYAEECAREVRRAMGWALDRVLTLEDIEDYAAGIPGLRIEHGSPDPVPYFHNYGDGTGVISLPRRYHLEQFVHELGHKLRGHGLSAYLLAYAEEGSRLQRLAEICGWQEEHQAQAFVIALLLPMELVLSHTDYQLAEMVPFSLTTIRLRRWNILLWARRNQADLRPYEALTG